MRWLADECVAATVVMQLRAAEHDVIYMAEDGSGTVDRAVLLLAQEEARLLLTEDKDFGELVFRSRMAAPGIVLLRLGVYDGHTKWKRLQAAIAQYGLEMFGRYVVVEDDFGHARCCSRYQARFLRTDAIEKHVANDCRYRHGR
jgi:predicted nuclease of predicted toxin-antitoxin system